MIVRTRVVYARQPRSNICFWRKLAIGAKTRDVPFPHLGRPGALDVSSALGKPANVYSQPTHARSCRQFINEDIDRPDRIVTKRVINPPARSQRNHIIHGVFTQPGSIAAA
jgi:hypothetical protein